jgi:hypothetical protein
MWPLATMVVGLIGEGPVPSFAPPKVPSGPVVGGKARSTGPLFTYPFGLPAGPGRECFQRIGAVTREFDKMLDDLEKQQLQERGWIPRQSEQLS